MEATAEVEAALRRALESAEATVADLRRALEGLQGRGEARGPSQEDLGVTRQLEDIVGCHKGDPG